LFDHSGTDWFWFHQVVQQNRQAYIMKFSALLLLISSVSAFAQTYTHSHLHASGATPYGTVQSSFLGGTVSGTGSNESAVYVQPRITQSGTLIEGHHRTSPDSSNRNNYSTSGNFNPYTGAVGTRSACGVYGCR
jgi:hypothetical protein